MGRPRGARLIKCSYRRDHAKRSLLFLTVLARVDPHRS